MTRTTQRVQRTTIGIFALAALLAGCAAADEPGAQSESPMPTATSEATSEAPEPSTEPSPAPSTEPPQCGDAYVYASNQSSTAPRSGTEDEVLAALDPRAGFAVPEALAGLDVLCTVTTTELADGPPNPDGTPRILTIGTAFVASTPDPAAALDVWTDANGYAPQDGSVGELPEHFAPTNADGSTTTKIVWMPVTNLGWDEARAAEESARLGVDVPIDGWVVFFYDFTIPQG